MSLHSEFIICKFFCEKNAQKTEFKCVCLFFFLFCFILHESEYYFGKKKTKHDIL